MSFNKERECEDIFAQFPYVDPLPRGVPLAELPFHHDPKISALLQGKQSDEDVQREILRRVDELALERSMKLDTFAAAHSAFVTQMQVGASTEKTVRRMSRKQSTVMRQEVSDGDSTDDESTVDQAAIDWQKVAEEREAEKARRRQEIANAKEEDARRVEQEDAMCHKRENDAWEIKSKINAFGS